MSSEWALQDAKNRLSEVVNNAIARGPQTITRRGRPAAVVVSIDQYRQMTASQGDVVSFFRKSPLVGVELDLERDTDTGRTFSL